MTDTAGPFDGAPWSEAQWARHAALWAPSGVYGTPASSTTTGDLPLSVSGLTVGLGAGRAWVRGFGFERTGAAVMQTVTANVHASFQRRDRIVLRRNLATHTVTPVLVTGTPAGTPIAPALTQSDAGSWDLPMFSFLVPPNSGTSISGLVDERGWTDPSTGLLAFASTAARDAYFPAPIAGQSCTVAGAPQIYTGSGWGSLINNGGSSGALVGSAAPAGTPLTVKTFYGSVVHNGLGDGQVTFPGGAFPNGLLAVNLIHYSPGTAPSNDLEFVPWGATLSTVNTRCYGPSGAVFGGTGVALVCTAIGW